MKEILSENKLIEECKKGKILYQEMLYKQFYGYAMSVCRLYTYSNEEAVSILNDSFLKTFDSIKKNKYKNSGPFKSWLRRILINTAIDYYRKNVKHLNHIEIEQADQQNVNVELIDQLTADDIIKLLDQLPEIHRIVFNLFEIQGYNHQEIAKQLNIGISTSRTYLTRAKKKLRILIHQNF